MTNSWAKWSLLPLLATATLVVPGRSDVKKGQGRGDEKKEDVLAKGQTVILGTWSWNIEKNKQGGKEGHDVIWQQATEKEQFLVPVGQAGLAILEKKSFDEITSKDLKGLKYSDNKIANDSLTPGTVLALRTNEGNFAKLKVVKYRELHDFSFPEAKLLDPKWKEFVLQKPNKKNYHLEVEWVLYPK